MDMMTLSNGKKLPMIGFGTFLATQGSGKETILQALQAGYRYLDTAAFYQNETQIGEALADCKKSGFLQREDVYLSSKVWRSELTYDKIIRSCEESLARLQTDYLDLFLIHWPRDLKDPDWKMHLQESWKAMEALYAEGKVRAIGVSNFLPHHLMVLEETRQVAPMLNQLELHIGYMQEAAVAYCAEKNIAVQAWSPLGRSALFQEPILQEMADRYQVSVAKLALQFLLQQGIAVIPKASSPARMKDNLELGGFIISQEDMSFLRCLPQMGWSGEHPDLG